MPINLESHGLPAVATYAPVTVQDQQGEGQQSQQQPAAEAGFSNASAFEGAPGASVGAGSAGEEAVSGGDLLSKLSGFIRAVGDVVVQLGEFIRSAGGAIINDEAPQPQAKPAEVPAAPAGAPAQAAVPGGAQSLLGAPGQPVTATALPALVPQAALGAPDARGATSPSLSRPSSTQRGATNPAMASLSMAASSVGAGVVPLRGGAGRPSSGAFPELNPLPPFHPAEEGFPGFPGFEPGVPLAPVEVPSPNQGHSATARPPVQPGYQLQLAAAQPLGAPEAVGEVQAAQDAGYVDNVLPFRRPSDQESAVGSEDQAAAQSEDPSADPRFSGIVFRPAFYGMLRC